MEGEEVKSGDASKSTENHRVFVVVMARGALPQAQLHGDNNLCCEGRLLQVSKRDHIHQTGTRTDRQVHTLSGVKVTSKLS